MAYMCEAVLIQVRQPLAQLRHLLHLTLCLAVLELMSVTVMSSLMQAL